MARPAKRGRSQDSNAFRGIMTRVNEQGWRDLKILAVEQGMTLNALAVEAFNDVLKKYGKKGSVENPLLD
jgi:antitoxin-like ribbon-helix-helix protein